MIPISIAEQLLKLVAGEQLPASKLQHITVVELIEEGIIQERITGRTKRTLYIADGAALGNWLFNKFAIHSLEDYITTLKNENAGRADLVAVSSDSKTRNTRTFKGFLLNSYQPIACTINGEQLTIHPVEGTFQFVYDFESFVPEPDVVIVGVENAENFRRVQKLQYLFKDIKPLFVSRYPQEQSKDLVKWLQSIPNRYIHSGDYDFAGINIYLTEYKKHLKERASFFIPDNIEQLLEKYGNRKIYDRQELHKHGVILEDNVQILIALLHKYKKGLEQEALLI